MSSADLIAGEGDPQEEVWSIAHSAEPGAVDNASGVAASIEIARAICGLAAARRLPPARRTIRLLAGYECYGFFNYVETLHAPANAAGGRLRGWRRRQAGPVRPER